MEEKNWHDKHEDTLDFSQKISEKLSKVVSSWKYLIIIALIVTAWIIGHTLGILIFDPYPFGLLKFLFSIHSFFFGLIIIISQSTQKQRDKIHADEDYKNDTEARKGVENIQKQLKDLEDYIKNK